jgi:hypothetical protein
MTVQLVSQETATRRVLVLAMPNVRCEELLRTMRDKARDGDARFSLVVPAVPLGLDWLADMSAGREIAIERLSSLLWRCRRANHLVDEAEIGDPDPMAAAMDAVNFGEFDEILLAGPRPSWAAQRMRMSLAERLRRQTGLPVEHIVSAPAAQLAPAESARVQLEVPAISRHQAAAALAA